MEKCLPEFEYFYIIFKIRRSKVTDYAALKHVFWVLKRQSRFFLVPTLKEPSRSF